MAEQLVAVGFGFLVLAWIVQAYSAFISKKGEPAGFHIGFISFYALGSAILGLDAHLSGNLLPSAANILCAIFAAAAYLIIRSK